MCVCCMFSGTVLIEIGFPPCQHRKRLYGMNFCVSGVNGRSKVYTLEDICGVFPTVKLIGTKERKSLQVVGCGG